MPIHSSRFDSEAYLSLRMHTAMWNFEGVCHSFFLEGTIGISCFRWSEVRRDLNLGLVGANGNGQKRMKRIVNDSKRHALEVKEGTVTP